MEEHVDPMVQTKFYVNVLLIFVAVFVNIVLLVNQIHARMVVVVSKDLILTLNVNVVNHGKDHCVTIDTILVIAYHVFMVVIVL